MALPPETQHERTRQQHHQKKQTKLNFEPLSSGLGFHPFSDGLPYAPVSKAGTSTNAHASEPKPMGTGAMAAGPATFANPATSPRIQAPRVPVASPTRGTQTTQTTQTAQPPHYPPYPRNPMAARTQARAAQPSIANAKTSAAEKIAAQLTPELLQPTFGFGYLFKRVFAYLVDSLFNLGLCAGALSAALWKQDLSPELLLNPGIVLVAALFLGFFNWAITTAEEVAFGTSIGKRMFGLAIQGSASAIFLRAFFFLPSLCFGGIGLLWAIFDRRRRCWHDLVVDLQPIEIARL